MHSTTILLVVQFVGQAASLSAFPSEGQPMPDLDDGASVEMQGSGSKPYVLKNTGGVYSCSCPAWRNQSTAIEKRTCKHLRKLRGDAAEEERVGSAAAVKPKLKTSDGDETTEVS